MGVFVESSRHQVTLDMTATHGINGTFNFGDWYQSYRHADGKTQKQMTNDFVQFIHHNTNIARQKDQKGDLPLHHVLAEGHGTIAPINMSILKNLLEAFPNSVQTPDGNGLLPLHLACRYGGYSSYEVISYLVHQWPACLQKKITISKRKRDMLPLHLAFEYGPMPMNIIELLVENYPQALMTLNGNGDLPLHIACKGYSIALSTLKLLVSMFPDALKISNAAGELPLHIACSHRNANSIQIINLFLESYPKAITCVTKNGELPLHCACNGFQSIEVVKLLVSMNKTSVTIPDLNSMLPLHHACRAEYPVMDVIRYLVQSYPVSTTIRGRNGYLPLHFACSFGANEAIMYLLDAYPEATKDNQTKNFKYPAQLLKKGNHLPNAVLNLLTPNSGFAEKRIISSERIESLSSSTDSISYDTLSESDFRLFSI